jgi:hypothetical protein
MTCPVAVHKHSPTERKVTKKQHFLKTRGGYFLAVMKAQ